MAASQVSEFCCVQLISGHFPPGGLVRFSEMREWVWHVCTWTSATPRLNVVQALYLTQFRFLSREELSLRSGLPSWNPPAVAGEAGVSTGISEKMGTKSPHPSPLPRLAPCLPCYFQILLPPQTWPSAWVTTFLFLHSLVVS